MHFLSFSFSFFFCKFYAISTFIYSGIAITVDNFSLDVLYFLFSGFHIFCEISFRYSFPFNGNANTCKKKNFFFSFFFCEMHSMYYICFATPNNRRLFLIKVHRCISFLHSALKLKNLYIYILVSVRFAFA